MQIPSTVSIWLSEQAIPIALIALSLIAILAILSYSAKRRVAVLRETRSGMNEDTFIESLMPYSFDPQICRTVYRYLQEKQNIGFPIEAADHLDEDLGLDLEDHIAFCIGAMKAIARELGLDGSAATLA